MFDSDLNELQKKFLTSFYETGDIDLACEMTGIENIHLVSWKRNFPKFDVEFRKYINDWTNEIRQKNKLLAIKAVNKALSEPLIERTVKTINKRDRFNKPFVEIHQTIKHIPISWDAVKLALTETSLDNIIKTLHTEGLISDNKANQLYNEMGIIRDRVQSVFDETATTDQLSEKKAIALVKKVLMGD